MPKTNRIIHTNQGYQPASAAQIFIGTIDEQTGAISGFSPIQFSDGFGGKCNLLSASASEFLCFDGSQVRHYKTNKTGAQVNFVKVVALAGAISQNCSGNCYMGTFAWDGAFYYFTSANSSSNQQYQVWKPDGAYVGQYTLGNGGGMSGAYFDWSVGRYATHDGWGGHGGGTKYKCAGCAYNDDSQAYSGVSSFHGL